MINTNSPPYHPIIYVRGFAATASEIDDTVSDPYMGFNLGSTRSRKKWSGDTQRFFFESPLVRLMSEYRYNDVFENGVETLNDPETIVPYSCVVIYRYYDEASEVFGTGKTPPIEHFAKELTTLILKLKKRIFDNPENTVDESQFRVYLVAHSMGGLICRAFLQNTALGSDEARKYVDKLFTYATPHNGIDMRIVRNIPGWLTFGDVDNFNRNRMAKYLALPTKGDDVSIVKNFDPARIFNLIGTNAKDYKVGYGASAWAAGDASDGLVRIENATTHGLKDGRDVQSPRAFVYRSHSGYYGIVNSEEGYQNLTRFLFGKLRVDGILDIDEITLPLDVQKKKDNGKDIKASYQFETAVAIRGAQWQVTRREVRENSAIFRTFDQLFPSVGGVRKPDRQQSPHLFSVFLDPEMSCKNGSVSFSFDVRILVPDYVIDGRWAREEHYEGGFIINRQIIIEAFEPTKEINQWIVKYGDIKETSGHPQNTAVLSIIGNDEGVAFSIPLEQKGRPGMTGTLRLEAHIWE